MSSQRQEPIEPIEAIEAREETARWPRKPYTKPKIIHELVLETRAGSPLGPPDLLDPLGLGVPRE